MQTYDEAVAVSKQNGDHFFLCAFMLRDWICNLMSGTLLTYHTTDHRPCDVLQDGQAWRGFCQLFSDDKHFFHALNDLFRFIQYDDRFANALQRAQVPLLIEEQLTGRLFAPQPTHSLRLLRRTAEFWCDWLDAIIHLEIHRAIQAHKRRDPPGADDLAIIGYPMCRLPSVQKSPSSTPGQPKPAPAPRRPLPRGFASLDRPSPPGEEIETLLIILQPLAKRYHWTASDCFTVIMELVRHPARGFCWAQCDLENYRQDELGLPPLEPDEAQLPGPLAGLALACKVCPSDSPPS